MYFVYSQLIIYNQKRYSSINFVFIHLGFVNILPTSFGIIYCKLCMIKPNITLRLKNIILVELKIELFFHKKYPSYMAWAQEKVAGHTPKSFGKFGSNPSALILQQKYL